MTRGDVVAALGDVLRVRDVCKVGRFDGVKSSTRRERWQRKFAHAFRGTIAGMHGHSSFYVHLPAAAAVLVLAAVLRMHAWQWAVLTLAIGLVLSLELFNSALELLSRGLSREQNERVGRALDVAAGAVLVGSLTAAATGAIAFLTRLAELVARG